MTKQLIRMADAEQDLHIAKHIPTESLPSMIQPILSLARSDSERDILLLSLLTASGSCLPNLYFRYGMAGKRYYPNLQCFVVGSAASGKGIANLALDLVKPIDVCTPLVIPGDATYPAFFRQLSRQGGRGYIHESEGSVITDIWRSSTATYNTALRKAAEHESISRTRCRETTTIDCPQVSMLLTGTFSQYKALVPGIENGYFSRLLTYIATDRQAFDSRYVEPSDAAHGIMGKAGTELYGLYERLLFMREQEFRLTQVQRERLGKHLEQSYPTLIGQLGENFHSIVLRMGVQIERIALILTALRKGSEAELRERNKDGEVCGTNPAVVDGDRWLCSDTDYQVAELIGNKLILHIAAAYRMINGGEESALPEVKPLDQRMMLLSLLPKEYESKQLVEEAKAQGVPRRTAFRWNEEWLAQGMLQKVKHGRYKKLAVSA